MAKKKKTTIVEESIPRPEDVMIKEPETKVTSQSIKKPDTKNKWEIKNRTYFLKNGLKPLSYMLRSANVYYFDEEKGYERELKYCSNQSTFSSTKFRYRYS